MEAVSEDGQEEKETRPAMKKLVPYIILTCAIAFGAGMAHISWDRVIMPISPTMVVDISVESEVCPLGYEPIEITGASTGVRKVVTCNVPIEYVQYVDYPARWDLSPLNPNSWVGKVTKYVLYFILVVVIGMLVWRFIKVYKKKKRR